MASRDKKKKLSKSERKKSYQDKGKKGAEARGLGAGSRIDFSLPAQWTTEIASYDHHDAVKYISPGKTKYHSTKTVKETLAKRKMDFCLDYSSESSGNEVDHKDADFEPDQSPKRQKMVHEEPLQNPLKVERQLCVCESSQIICLIEDVNKTSCCSTPDCNGQLIPSRVETVGLGGTINITFACSGCQLRSVSFQGSSMVEASRRTVVGLALAVAFIVSGHGFAKFHRTLYQCLGIQAISKNRFFEVIKLIYPHILDILTEMCDEEKEQMKRIDSNVLGSWQRAVVTSDGVWHTRGHFSKNGSFIIKNYLTGGLLWFGHKCMRGNSDDDDLFLGTAKSMEGILADECYHQAKSEGCNVVVVWQDGDSSSQKSVEKVFGAEPRRVFKCGGHVGRAHANNLKELAKQKVFSAGQISKWKDTFPAVESAKCACKRHSKTCGCLSDAFIQGAQLNHFCCLQQCKSPDNYARRMRTLGGHHCKSEHQWDDGKCDFHPSIVCSCGKCNEDEEISCEGKAYSTKSVLKCEFHQLAYQTECELRANDAEAVIHPELGRGQSNLCEAHFTVLPHFRAKDQSLCRLHYITSTNCGLAQGNMTWCFKHRGPEYHWIVDLYDRMNLPVLPKVLHAFQKASKERMKELEKKKTDQAKQKRVSHKIARSEDQEERKKWVKRQAILHTYGAEDEDDGSEEDRTLIQEAERIMGGEETEIVSGRKCRCGSTTHLRTSSRLCPLNKNNAS